MKTTLYRKRDDGCVDVHEVNRDSYSSQDAYLEAVDWYYSMNYYDNYEDAKNS